MIEIIDLLLNQYLRIFVGIVLVSLILFSLYFLLKGKIKKKSNIQIENKD
jgi:hypothetical protein